jgi:hypothetical protein
MAGMGDMMARAQAAQGMMREGAGMGEELPPEAMMPEEAAPEAPAMDLESALAGVEAAIEGEAPEKAEEIRTHLNAIREIAGGGGEVAPEEAGLEELAEGAPPAEAELPPEMPA